ncbi:MAG: protoporphyrinogen oxidase, partial [Actinomycetota bacterium]|nr:protoporphyrinogen oxidase [Actinomycetota bacterium]
RSHRSLLRAARAARPAASQQGAVFASVPGGLGRLVSRLAAVLAEEGARLRTGVTVRELSRCDDGWQLILGATRAPERLTADAVVLALPAAPAGRLLSGLAGLAAAELAAIDYASVAIVTLAYPRAAARRPLRGSGFLVPAVEGRVVKAATYSSQKWASIGTADPALVLVRCSVGRSGDTADLQREDADLVSAVTAELALATGLTGPPVDTRVTRWGGALPQYAVGHLDRVRRVRAALAGWPSLALAGAAYDGVGIPACVRSGRAAAARVLGGLPVVGSESRRVDS